MTWRTMVAQLKQQQLSKIWYNYRACEAAAWQRAKK